MKQLVLVISLILGSFHVDAKCKGKHLQCVAASAQAFIGGAAGSPSGIKYRLSFIAISSSDKLSIDQLWIGDDYYEVNAFVEKPSGANPNFDAGDTLIVSVTKLSENPIKLNNQNNKAPSTKKLKPYAFKGEALVGYKQGNKRKYLGVEKFEKLKRENYQ